MARLVHRLRPADVTAAEGPALLNDGFGLYLQVDGSGNKSWIFRFKLPGGRTRDMGLGSASTIPLKQARDRANAARLLKDSGTDPIDERAARLKAAAEARQAAGAEPTFEAKAREWHTANKDRWESKKNQVRWLSSMEQYAFPKIGRLMVSQVNTDAVLRVIRPIWHSKNHTANRVRGQIESVLSAAKVEGLRTGDNPARWTDHLSEILPKPRKVSPAVNHPALPYAELPLFMQELRQSEGIPARALEFLILNASRTGEVVGALRSEFDLDKALWHIPGPRMKMRKPHTVPLCARSIEILRDLPHESGNDFVFVGGWAGRHIGKMAMPDLLTSMRDDIVVHGFRACFSTWVAEETEFPTDIREAALAHKVGDNSAAAYHRGELLKKRRALMDAWSKYCNTPPKTADILPMNHLKNNFATAL